MDKILVGMSGGVDSSVTAQLLMESYDVVGATMKLFSSDDIVTSAKTCCAITDVEDARAVCNRLGLAHHVFNFTDAFYDDVIARFAACYQAGVTPNPCIDCNRYVKFPGLIRRADQMDIPYVATGHYARIAYDAPSGRYRLLRAVDGTKDQSYVLYAMTQQELSRTLFPLGGYEKAEIRAIAERAGLRTANKPESQDICFVPDGDYVGFLTQKMGVCTSPGLVVDPLGNVLGKHEGAVRYTIGQRRGLGIAAAHPLYVIGKDMAENTVTVGGQDLLMRDSFEVHTPNWVAIETLDHPIDVSVMTRYRDREVFATIRPVADGRVSVALHTPKRAITPGQAAVFYQGDVVIGGGVIV